MNIYIRKKMLKCAKIYKQFTIRNLKIQCFPLTVSSMSSGTEPE